MIRFNEDVKRNEILKTLRNKTRYNFEKETALIIGDRWN